MCNKIREICELFAHLIIFADEVLDIVYYCTTDFATEHLQRACLAFLIISPALQYLITLCLCCCWSGEECSIWKIIFYPLAASTKIGIFFFKACKSRIVVSSNTKRAVLCVTLTEVLFENFPQLFIQGFNNTQNEVWNGLAIGSFIFSVLSVLVSFCLGCYKCIDDDEEDT